MDEAISIIKQVQPSLPDVLFDKYFRNTRYVFAPTQQQKDYLKSMDTLEVLCVERDAPYVYQKEGKPAGMMVEILNNYLVKDERPEHVHNYTENQIKLKHSK